jgi:uncharacterized protein YjdB
MEVGDETTLRVNFSNDKNYPLSWDSSNPTVASVDNNGKINALREGKTIITITAANDSTATCTITVNPKFIEVEYVSLDVDTLTLDVKETYQLLATVYPLDASNQNVSWISSNENIVTVKDGLLTAVSVGNATVNVLTEDGNKKDSVEINVVQPVESIALSEEQIDLNVGESHSLTVSIFQSLVLGIKLLIPVPSRIAPGRPYNLSIIPV